MSRRERCSLLSTQFMQWLMHCTTCTRSSARRKWASVLKWILSMAPICWNTSAALTLQVRYILMILRCLSQAKRYDFKILLKHLSWHMAIVSLPGNQLQLNCNHCIFKIRCSHAPKICLHLCACGSSYGSSLFITTRTVQPSIYCLPDKKGYLIKLNVMMIIPAENGSILKPKTKLGKSDLIR